MPRCDLNNKLYGFKSRSIEFRDCHHKRTFCISSSSPSMPSTVERDQTVECKNVDGIVIRGCFYAVAGRAPTIIMTPGIGTTPRHSELENMLIDHSSIASRRCYYQSSLRSFKTLATML